MSDDNRPLTDSELGQAADRAREIGGEAAEARATRGGGGLESGRPEDDTTRDVFADDAGALERSQRIRAEDDAHTDERQERLARMEAEAAEALRRNAETLRETAEGLAETREQVRRIAADTRELAADVRATRQDTEKVSEAVRATPPVVDPAAVSAPPAEPPRGGA